MAEPKNCSQCKQPIMWHEGLNKFVNWVDGINGRKGDVHYHRPPDMVTCNRCGLVFDYNEFYQCYFCFLQCCQKCGKLFIWSKHQNRCTCGHICSKTITMSRYDRACYVKKDPEFIQYEIEQFLMESKI